MMHHPLEQENIRLRAALAEARDVISVLIDAVEGAFGGDSDADIKAAATGRAFLERPEAER